jgi:hypothetical protein
MADGPCVPRSPSREAKYKFQEVVAFLRDPKSFGRLGARIPKGVQEARPRRIATGVTTNDNCPDGVMATNSRLVRGISLRPPRLSSIHGEW